MLLFQPLIVHLSSNMPLVWGEVNASLCSILYGQLFVDAAGNFVQLPHKGALDKCYIIPQLSTKKVGIFITLEVLAQGNDSMVSFTFYIGDFLKKYEYF